MKHWWSYSLDLTSAALEAQHVIALRSAKLAKGGKAAAAEGHLMVTEKIAASAEAAATLASGGSPVAVLNRYRSLMRANIRRLSR